MADFDAIVVGSGCAGPIAAYELAKAGKSVLVVERGNYAGAKNMTGGRLYAHSIRRVFPDIDDMPYERRIIRERISLLSSASNLSIDFSSAKMKIDGQESYSVLRGVFDQWLASKAEDEGAEYIYGIAVEEIIKDKSGKACGIRAGEDKITADVVILCDGANSLLAERTIGHKASPASQVAVGIKQVFALPAETITNRILGTCDEDGASWLFVGDVTKGVFGGGFMYTNKESVSLGIVAGIEAVSQGNCPIYQMMEDFKQHPDIAAIIAGAEMVEHSGHMVPEGGFNIMPPLVHDGMILAGDCAGMCINYGYVVRGMDYAIAAGQMAGQAAVMALDDNDASAAGLRCYQAMLDDSFVMKDLSEFKSLPFFMEGFDRMFNSYPAAAAEIMNGMFIVNGRPTRHVKQVLMPAVKNVGVRSILRDARGVLKHL